MSLSTTPHPGIHSPWPRRLAWAFVAMSVAGVSWYGLTSRKLAALTLDEQRELTRQATEWIEAERQTRRSRGLPLAASEMELFAPYFPREVLETVRVQAVDEMPSPQFLGTLRHRGERIFDLSRAEGLALDDTVLLRGSHIAPGSPARRSVLFHELVHCVQYRAAGGIEPFIDQYLASLVSSGYSYPDIVFEHQAFELQHRFMVQPEEPFSVAEEVQRLLVGEASQAPPAR